MHLIHRYSRTTTTEDIKNVKGCLDKAPVFHFDVCTLITKVITAPRLGCVTKFLCISLKLDMAAVGRLEKRR